MQLVLFYMIYLFIDLYLVLNFRIYKHENRQSSVLCVNEAKCEKKKRQCIIAVYHSNALWLKRKRFVCRLMISQVLLVTYDSGNEKLSDNPTLAFHPAKSSTPSPRTCGIAPPLIPAPLLFPSTHIHIYTGPFIKSRERPRNFYRVVSRRVHDVPFVLLWNSRCPPRITRWDRDG